MSRVLIVVTVDTQQLPVAAVRWIVIVVVILMMNRELSNSPSRKFTPASCTYFRKHFERSLSIGLLQTRPVLPGLGYNLIYLVRLCARLLR